MKQKNLPMRIFPSVLIFYFAFLTYKSNAQQVMNQMKDPSNLAGNLTNVGMNPVSTASLGNTNKNINAADQQIQGNYFANQAPVQQQAFDNNVIQARVSNDNVSNSVLENNGNYDQSYSPAAQRSRSSMSKLNLHVSTGSASSGSASSSSHSKTRTHQASAALQHFLKKEENLVRKKKSRKKKAKVDVAACWH
jgi:hypothetical protein